MWVSKIKYEYDKHVIVHHKKFERKVMVPLINIIRVNFTVSMSMVLGAPQVLFARNRTMPILPTVKTMVYKKNRLSNRVEYMSDENLRRERVFIL